MPPLVQPSCRLALEVDDAEAAIAVGLVQLLEAAGVAKPGKGDASLRLKDVMTGASMPEARLEKVGDSAKIATPSVTS